MNKIIHFYLSLPLLFSSISLFAIDVSIDDADTSEFEISWPSSAGKTYTIKRSNDLNNLSGQASGHEATPPSNNLILNTSDSPQYFIQVTEDIDDSYEQRSAAYAMNKRLGRGNNFMASKIQFNHAYLSDFELLRESGFDHCRIGSNLHRYTGTNNYDTYKDRFKQAVDYAIEAGLNVIIDPVHHWCNDDHEGDNPNTSGNVQYGDPASDYLITQEDIDAGEVRIDENVYDVPTDSTIGSVLQATETNYYTHRFRGTTDDFVKLESIWTDIATLFKDYPTDQAVFEIVNEPRRGYSIYEVLTTGISAIRGVAGNEERIVIIAGGYSRLPLDQYIATSTLSSTLSEIVDSNRFRISGDTNALNGFTGWVMFTSGNLIGDYFTVSSTNSVNGRITADVSDLIRADDNDGGIQVGDSVILLDTDPGMTTRAALIDGFNNDYFPTDDPYLIGTFHYYDPRPFTKQGNITPGDDGIEGVVGERWGDDASDYQQVIDDFDAVDDANNSWATRNDTTPLPIYQGEFGVDNIVDDFNNGDRKRWLSWVRLQCEKRGYSWAHWNMYNNSSNSKGLGPFDLPTTNSMVYFDFEEFTSGGTFSPALDKSTGSSANSLWGMSSARGFQNTIPADGIYRLENDGTDASYGGVSYGNTQRAEWGLTYNGYPSVDSDGDGVVDVIGGRINTGFATNSGKFSVEYSIDGWDLSNTDGSRVAFQARDATEHVVAEIRLIGNTTPIVTTNTVESSLIDFDFENADNRIADAATGADPNSLFALPSSDVDTSKAFFASSLTDGRYKIEKRSSAFFSGQSIGNSNRALWGMQYSGATITQGFGKYSEEFSDLNGNSEYDAGEEFSDTNSNGIWDNGGEIVIELDMAAWDLSNSSGNPYLELQFLDTSGNLVTAMRIVGNTHTQLFCKNTNGITVQHKPGATWDPDSTSSSTGLTGSTWGQAGLKRGSEKSDSLDDIQTVKMKVDFVNNQITLTARERDFTFSDPGLYGKNIHTLKLITNNFATPDFVTIDRLRVHDGSSTSEDVIIGYDTRTWVRALGINPSNPGSGTTFAQYLLDNSSASGTSSHKLGVSVDYDTGEFTLSVDDNTISPIDGVTLDTTTLTNYPIHSIRLVTSSFQQTDYVDFDDVAFYEGTYHPTTLPKTSDGIYGGNPKTSPELRFFDAEPLEGLIGSYEFEDVSSNTPSTDYKGYSGSGYVNFDGTTISLESVYAPYQPSGSLPTYGLEVRYSSLQDETLTLSENGNSVSVTFPSTGSIYDWGNHTIPITLSEGEHEINLSGTAVGTINFDKAMIKLSE